MTVTKAIRTILLTTAMLGVAATLAHADILKPPPKPDDEPAPVVLDSKAKPVTPEKVDPAIKGEHKSYANPGSPAVTTVTAKGGYVNPYPYDYIGDMKTCTAKYEDTMVQLARTYNIGFVELRAANPFLDPWMPGAGKTVTIPAMHLLPRAPHQGIVINLAEMRMYVYLRPGTPLSYPLGIGREGLSTPSGTTTIVRKQVGPIWRPTPRMRKEHPELPVQVDAGPDNPMGTHAMYLGWPEYAIHGTDKPFSIGRRASSGCIRMYPENIKSLFQIVPVGTQVTVVNQPIKLGWVGNKLYMEAHLTTDQADKMELDGGLPGYVFTEEDMGMIAGVAGKYADQLNWPLIRQVVRERRGYPVEIFERPGSSSDREETHASAAAAADADESEDIDVSADDADDDHAPAAEKPRVEKASEKVTAPNADDDDDR